MKQRSTFNSIIFALLHFVFFLVLSTLIGVLLFGAALIWNFKVFPHNLIDLIQFTPTKNGSNHLVMLTWGALLAGGLTCFAIFLFVTKCEKKNDDIHHRGARFEGRGTR